MAGMLLTATSTLAEDGGAREQHERHIDRSAINSAVKAKFRLEHVGSLKHVDVETDRHGIVLLRGHVSSQDTKQRAESLARDTEGVRDVRNHIKVKHDD